MFDISNLKYTTEHIVEISGFLVVCYSICNFQIIQTEYTCLALAATNSFYRIMINSYSMEDTLIELTSQDLEHFIPPVSMEDVISVFVAYDISFIRNFSSDLYYVEMVDGEPLVPLNPMGSYSPGIEKLFDLMSRERMNMLSYREGKIWCSYFQVNSEDL
jgi:hypothetical protein